MKAILIALIVALLFIGGCATPQKSQSDTPEILRGKVTPGVFLYKHPETGKRFIVIIRPYDLRDPALVRWYIDQKMREPRGTVTW